MIKALRDLENDRLGLKTIFHALMGIAILFVGNILASLPVDLFYAITKIEPSIFILILRPLLEITVLFLLVWLYISKVLKMSLRDFRICKPRNIAIWALCALVLPVVVSAFFILFIQGTFTVSNFDTTKNIRILLRAIFSSCLAAGITEELVFRGLIMRLLENRWNKVIAAIVPSFCFGLLHILNMESPNISDIIILIVAGTAVGIMFSLIAMESGSIWASALVHGLWNFVIIGGILEISAEPLSSIFTYTLTSHFTSVTGGAFGIESSLPSIVGYCVVICVALVMLNGTSKNKGASS
jgi:membrane protease YdiL (CAAX protease family)